MAEMNDFMYMGNNNFSEDVTDGRFVLIHFNVFDKQCVIPSEVAILYFSLKMGIGVSRLYHTLIGIEERCDAIIDRMLQHSAQTHRIPITIDGNLEAAFASVANFITKHCGNIKTTPVFASPENYSIALAAIKKYGGPHLKDLRVLDASLLLFHLRNMTYRNENLHGPYDVSVARNILMEDKYKAVVDLACVFHAQVDNPKHCSKAIVIRLAIIICEYCCEIYDIRLIEGMHYPKGFHARAALFATSRNISEHRDTFLNIDLQNIARQSIVPQNVVPQNMAQQNMFFENILPHHGTSQNVPSNSLQLNIAPGNFGPYVTPPQNNTQMENVGVCNQNPYHVEEPYFGGINGGPVYFEVPSYNNGQSNTGYINEAFNNNTFVRAYPNDGITFNGNTLPVVVNNNSNLPLVDGPNVMDLNNSCVAFPIAAYQEPVNNNNIANYRPPNNSTVNYVPRNNNMVNYEQPMNGIYNGCNFNLFQNNGVPLHAVPYNASYNINPPIVPDNNDSLNQPGLSNLIQNNGVPLHAGPYNASYDINPPIVPDNNDFLNQPGLSNLIQNNGVPLHAGPYNASYDINPPIVPDNNDSLNQPGLSNLIQNNGVPLHAVPYNASYDINPPIVPDNNDSLNQPGLSNGNFYFGADNNGGHDIGNFNISDINNRDHNIGGPNLSCNNNVDFNIVGSGPNISGSTKSSFNIADSNIDNPNFVVPNPNMTGFNISNPSTGNITTGYPDINIPVTIGNGISNDDLNSLEPYYVAYEMVPNEIPHTSVGNNSTADETLAISIPIGNLSVLFVPAESDVDVALNNYHLMVLPYGTNFHRTLYNLFLHQDISFEQFWDYALEEKIQEKAEEILRDT